MARKTERKKGGNMVKFIKWWNETLPAKIKAWPMWLKIIIALLLAFPEWFMFFGLIALIDKWFLR